MSNRAANNAAWPRRLAVVAAVLVVMCLSSSIGLRFGKGVVERYERGAFIPWESVPLPGGERPRSLATGEGPYVYVETDNGSLFRQSLGVFQGNAWSVPERPTSGDTESYDRIGWHCGPEASPAFDSLLMGKPPGVVVEQLDCSYTETDFGGSICRYVVLENGELWRWRKNYTRFSALDTGFRVSAFLVGLAAVWGASGALLFGASICAAWMVLRRLESKPRTDR
jgi:hypothetical protein